MTDKDRRIIVKQINEMIVSCREQKNKALRNCQSMEAIKLEGEMEGYRNIKYFIEHRLI